MLGVSRLVLVHGSVTGGALTWGGQIRELGERFRLLVVDRPGFQPGQLPGFGHSAHRHPEFSRVLAEFVERTAIRGRGKPLPYAAFFCRDRRRTRALPTFRISSR